MTAPRYAVRSSRFGWERWNNFTGEWDLLPFVISVSDGNAARAFVAALFGIRVRDVVVEVER